MNLHLLRFILTILALTSLSLGQNPAVEPSHESRIADLARRVSQLEAKSESPTKEKSSDDNYRLGGVAFLFGGFCALWAQNTKRNPWLWFFFGMIFSVIAVIVVLVKNGDDRFARQQWQRYTGKTPPDGVH